MASHTKHQQWSDKSHKKTKLAAPSLFLLDDLIQDKLISTMKSDDKMSNYGALDGNDKETKKPDEAPAPHQQHSILGILYIMLGSFSFSIMFLLAKLMEGTADAFTLVFYRSLVQIAIALTAIIRNGENPIGQAGELTRFWLFVRGGFGAGAVIAWFFGIQNLPLPDAVTLQFTTPPFAAVFAVCLVGEKWLRLDMIGAAVCLAGVALIAHPTWLFGHHEGDEVAASGGEDPLMKAFAVGVTEAGAAMAGIAYVSVRLIGERASANVMVLYYGCLSIPIVLFGSRWLLGKWSVWGDGFFSPWDYFMLFLTGLAGYGGQYYTNLGLQKETAATGTLATSTQIVWTYVFELAFLHEGINGWSLAGTALILGFMLIVGHLKLTQATNSEHITVAGETEETALLYASERNEGPAHVEEP